MAAAHVLHYGVGVPVRKVPAVLRALTGVELSQGAISQDALSCGVRCVPVHSSTPTTRDGEWTAGLLF